MKSKQLKVQPVRKYTIPRYPSYLDKNPIEHPKTLPYPFQRKVLYGLLLTGLFTSISATNPTPPHHLPKNTFSIATTGLPHAPSTYGTGSANKMDVRLARSYILKIFAEEGIPLQKDYLYKDNDFIVQLDGYHPDLKIGFSWLTWENLSPDNFDRYNAVLFEVFNFGDLKNLYQKYKRSFGEEQLFQERFHDKMESLEKSKDSISLDDLKKVEYELVTYYYAFGEAFKKDKRFLNLKAQEAFTLPKEEQSAAFEYVYFRYKLRLNNVLIRHMNEDFATEFRYYVNEYIHELQGKTLQQYFRVSRLLKGYALRYFQHRFYPVLKECLTEFEQTNDIGKLEKRLLAIEPENMSFEELKGLERQMTENKVFIAPISSFDSRFQYGYPKELWENSYYPSAEFLQVEIDANTIEDEEKRKEFIQQGKIEVTMNHPTKPMKALEKQVREYIHWAKSQGM